MKHFFGKLCGARSAPVSMPERKPTAAALVEPAPGPRSILRNPQAHGLPVRSAAPGSVRKVRFQAPPNRRAVASALEVWVDRSPPAELKFRSIAAKKIQQAFDQEKNALCLTALQLTSLPACLHHLEAIKELSLDFNTIADLPALPSGLRKLYVRDNKLAALPLLPDTLVVLVADRNQFSCLPDLPVGLRILQVGDNRLTELPTPPTMLRMVNASKNQIVELPAGLEMAMTSGYLNLEHNPLSARSIARLQTLPAAVNVFFDGSAHIAALRTIAADSPYYPLQEMLLPFAEEPNADQFFRLLSALDGTAEGQAPALRPALIARVTAMVEAMQESPDLRQLCFSVAVGATAECVDLTTLVLNDLQMACLDHHAEHGMLGEDELYTLGQALCKMGAVDRIVSAKAATLPEYKFDICRIEVRLGYHTLLAEPLQLPGVARAMAYHKLHCISATDLQEAISTVQADVNGGALADFLTAWRPWQNAMEKRHAAEVGKIESCIAIDRAAIAIQPDDLSDQALLEIYKRQTVAEREAASDFINRATAAFIAQSRSRAGASASGAVMPT